MSYCDLSLMYAKDIEIKKNVKRFIMTSYVLGSTVDKDFLKALKLYEKKEKAQLLIFPLKNGKTEVIDEVLANETFVLQDTKLNSNLKLLSLFSKGNSYNQPQGLGRVSNRGESCIVGGSAITLKYTPTVKGKLPHFVATTGSISLLEDVKVKLSKANYLAKLDHKLGAMIVEIEDSDFFHQRHVEFNTKTKSFTDLGTQYSTKNTIKKNQPSTLVLGDWHSMETDLIAVGIWKAITKNLKISTWVLHDFFDGSSINHHEDYNSTKKTQKAISGRLSLDSELKYFIKDLTNLSVTIPNIVIVKSNHDEFLNRYINEARYNFEPHNRLIALKLHIAMIEFNKDPLCEAFNIFKTEIPSNVKFLERDDSFKVGGVELAAHGDRGANGMKRGSPATFENAYGKCVVGHSHTPQIMREVYVVGTTTSPFPDYGDGPNSWVQASCLVYPDGTRQLLNIINGKVTTKKL